MVFSRLTFYRCKTLTGVQHAKRVHRLVETLCTLVYASKSQTGSASTRQEKNTPTGMEDENDEILIFGFCYTSKPGCKIQTINFFQAAFLANQRTRSHCHRFQNGTNWTWRLATVHRSGLNHLRTEVPQL